MIAANTYWVYTYGIQNPAKPPRLHVPTLCILRKGTAAAYLAECTCLKNLSTGDHYWVLHNTDHEVFPYAFLWADPESLTPELLQKIRASAIAELVESVTSLTPSLAVTLP